jgi:Trypsin-like peptidase domain
MNKIRNIVIMAVMMSVSSFAGVFPADPRMVPVLIELPGIGAGSGCFVQVSNSVYLATAKHVLFQPSPRTNSPNLRSPIAVITCQSDMGDTNVSKRGVFLNLVHLVGAGEIRASTNRDVALVRIEECNPTNRALVNLLSGVAASDERGWTTLPEDFMCPLAKVDIGAQVFMFGYPISLTAPIQDIFDPSEPLLRMGIVAGVSLAKRTLIIDCPSYMGNSGGPVVEVRHPSPEKTEFVLIGIVSSFVPFQEEWENKTLQYSHVIKSNSGYTVIEPIDFIQELVWK